MKHFMIFSILGFFAVGANAEIIANVITNAKVVDVQCESPTIRDHDVSSAGTVTIAKEGGEILNMRIVISRFLNTQREARMICNQLKSLYKSGQQTDVIYEKVQSIYSDELEMKILGVSHLPGANPFNEG